MEEQLAVGQHLRLHKFDSTPEEFVSGRFHSFNPERTRITLTDVTFHPEQIHFPNQMYFFLKEIKHSTLLHDA